jgi:hypothetical protein
MVRCVVGDETATSNAFFKGEVAKLVAVGNVLAIRNGLKRFVKNFISLEVDIFGRVTLEKDVGINTTGTLNISTTEHPFDRKKNDRRDNRQGDRQRNNRPRNQ